MIVLEKLYKENQMACKPKIFFPDEMKRSIREFISSPETQRVLNDPKAQEVLTASVSAVARLAKERQKASEITFEMWHTPTTC